MYANITADSTQRITEIRESLDFFGPLIPPAPTGTPRHFNTLKGLIFVQLYGVIEFTIRSTISKTIEFINNDSVALLELKPLVWSLAACNQLEALNNANTKKWNKRIDLFQRFHDNANVQIPTDIIPTNGQNYTAAQLDSIWQTFSITDPIFSNNAFKGRLQEIVTNRINISHGNITASEVGARVTAADLYARIVEVSQFCSYFVSVFEDYTIHRKFRK